MVEIVVHHEGGGVPDDDFRQLETAKYSGGIGLSSWKLVRAPAQSFETGDPSLGDSLQVCFSGNREFYPVTATDVRLFAGLCDEARRRGWIPPIVGVRFHGEVPGEATACPGRYTYALRDELTRAAQASAPRPKVPPMFSPPLILEPIVDDAKAPNGGAWLLGISGAVYAFLGAPYHGGANGKPYFAGRAASRLDPVDVPKGGGIVKGYRITATSGETYTFPE